MANEKIETTQNIITPPVGDREKEERLLEALKAIPDEEIVRLWEEKDLEDLKENLEKYNSGKRTGKLSINDADLLIGHWEYTIALSNIDTFFSRDHKQIIMKMIDYIVTKPAELTDFISVFHTNKEKIRWLDKNVAKKILDTKNKGLIEMLLDDVEIFSGLDKEIARAIIDKAIINPKDKDLVELFLENLAKNNERHFDGLDDEIVQLLCNLWYARYVRHWIDECWEKFFPKNIKKSILIIIKKWEQPSFRYLSQEILDDENFEDEIINLKWFGVLTSNIRYFPAENHKRIVLKLVKAGYKEVDYLTNCKNLDKETAMAIIDAWCYKGKRLDTLYHFSWLDKEVIMKLINDDENNISWIARHQDYFKGIDAPIILMFISHKLAWDVINNIRRYNCLNDEIANALIDAWYVKYVKKYKDLFKDLGVLTKMRLWWKKK